MIYMDSDEPIKPGSLSGVTLSESHFKSMRGPMDAMLDSRLTPGVKGSFELSIHTRVQNSPADSSTRVLH